MKRYWGWLRLASHLGKSLDETLADTSGPQYLVWQEYLNRIERTPTLTELYLMQVCAEVRRVLAKDPRRIKLEHFRLKFEDDQPKITPEQELAITKAMWAARLGRKK